MSKKIAEILVRCGYAETLRTHEHGEELDEPMLMWYCPELDNIYEDVDLSGDSLESRQLMDAMEDWFDVQPSTDERCESLWEKSGRCVMSYIPPKNFYWRQERIDWCLEQLDEE